MQSRLKDVTGVLKGFSKILNATVESQIYEKRLLLHNSSIPQTICDVADVCMNSVAAIGPSSLCSRVVDRTQLMGKQNIILCQRLREYLKSQPHSVTPIDHDHIDSSLTIESSDFLTADLDTARVSNSNQSEELAPTKVDANASPTPMARPLPMDDKIAASADQQSNVSRRLFLSILTKTMSFQRLAISKERRVPSSRIGRIAGFGNAADGSSAASINPLLTDANVQRIVNTLCRMRGAALKLGQMLSIQDDSLVSPQIQKMFERVRQAADFMPIGQMHKVLIEEFGSDWRDLLAEFDERPFAAASIGQVHRAKLHDGRIVAMKIQYPGVAGSIDADISNLMTLLGSFKILPRGLFADRAVEVATRELRDECDYIREASYCKKFRDLLADDVVYEVPKVVDELTTSRVFTSEYIEGLVLDDCNTLPQDVRNWIGTQLLRLCLKEIFVFHTMQTDPNWSNFLYNPTSGKVGLLDFGASRDYSKEFSDDYIRLIYCASKRDREGILEHSAKLGFLTGYETKVMVQAHVDAVSILGEAFASEMPFDFGHQSTTHQVNSLIPVMLEHRLTPPPEESYSLHRKMSGCFLLCSKLKATVHCRPLFYEIWDDYRFGAPASET